MSKPRLVLSATVVCVLMILLTAGCSKNKGPGESRVGKPPSRKTHRIENHPRNQAPPPRGFFLHHPVSSHGSHRISVDDARHF
jgi:hypothetical protein